MADRRKDTREARFSVIDSTTPALGFAEDLELYRVAAVDGIGISERTLGVDREDLARFQASGLCASSCFLAAASILPVGWVPGPEDPTERLASLHRSVRRLAPFEPCVCHIVTGPCGPRQPAEARAIVVAGMRELATATADAGMTLALEVMHHTLTNEFTFVNTIPDAIKLLDEVGHPNVALALDVWHLEEPDMLAHVRDHAGRVATLHVNDRRDPTRSWCDRVLPGDGVADLPGVLQSLADGGYDGWYELEILSDDGSFADDFPDSLWKKDPLDVVTRGRQQFLSAWRRRGESARL